jgi:hypothetical protein
MRCNDKTSDTAKRQYARTIHETRQTDHTAISKRIEVKTLGESLAGERMSPSFRSRVGWSGVKGGSFLTIGAKSAGYLC